MDTLAETLPYHPNLIIKKLNSLYHTRMDRREYNTEGINIFAEDWDNLVILDACRDDQFRVTNTLAGEVETKISRGSNTSEFLKANCNGHDLRDTVYVTASPIYYYHRDAIDAEFHEVVNVWNEEGWHEDVKTVLPETTTEYALDAADEYPDKRLLVHYIQPHYPFIESDTEFDKKQLHEGAENEKSFWHELNHGDLGTGGRRAQRNRGRRLARRRRQHRRRDRLGATRRPRLRRDVTAEDYSFRAVTEPFSTTMSWSEPSLWSATASRLTP